jgi:HlyD family secretion protein
MKKRILLIIAVMAAVTGTAAAYYRANADEDSPAFQTSKVTRGDVVQTVDATGALEAVTTVQVSTQVSGTIKALFADFNSKVKKGQVVAELDPSLMQTQVAQAQASLVKLQADVERARVDVDDTQAKLRRAQDLSAQQLIPRTDLETAETNARQAEAAVKSAEAQVAQARASLNQSQVNLAHTIIRAPIDGIVMSRSVDVGQTVAASMSAPTLFVIAQDLGHMQVNASIDESDIGRIQAGQAVDFRVDAYPGETFHGTVSQVRLEPVTVSNVVNYVTIIDVPNPELKLKPGMTATVSVEIARADDVVRVPAAALRFRPAPAANAVGATGARVFEVRDGVAHQVPVETGISDGTMTAIVAGNLSDHATVITGLATTPVAATTAASPLLPFGGRRSGNGQTRQAASRGQGAAR